MRVKAQVGRTWGELVPLQDAHLLTADQPAVASGGGGPVNAPQVGAKGSHIAEVGDNRANASLRSDGDNDGVGACAGDAWSFCLTSLTCQALETAELKLSEFLLWN